MIKLKFNQFIIELEDDFLFTLNSVDNTFNYDFVYQDEVNYYSSKHGIKLFKDEKLYKSAIVCATAGVTEIHENSAVIVREDILICCANKVFSLSLPDLKLNWVKKLDFACCFQIVKNQDFIFVHGELDVSRIDRNGNIIWSVSFSDITVTPNGKDSFVMHEDFIEVEDWNHIKYKVNFDGKFI